MAVLGLPKKKGSRTNIWCTFYAWSFHKKGSLQTALKKPSYIYHILSIFCIHFRENTNFSENFTSRTFFCFLSYHCKISGKTNEQISRKTSCKSIYVLAYTAQKFHISIWQCQQKYQCMFWKTQHFGAVVLCIFSLVCQCRGSIIFNQMFCNNYCSLFISFSSLFIHIV